MFEELMGSGDNPQNVEVIHKSARGEVLNVIKKTNSKYTNNIGYLRYGMQKNGGITAPLGFALVTDPNYVASPTDQPANTYAPNPWGEATGAAGLNRSIPSSYNFTNGTPFTLTASKTWTYAPTNTATKTGIYGIVAVGPNYQYQYPQPWTGSNAYNGAYPQQPNLLPPYIAQPNNGTSTQATATGPAGFIFGNQQQSAISGPAMTGQPTQGTASATPYPSWLATGLSPSMFQMYYGGTAGGWTVAPTSSNYATGLIPGEKYTAIAYVACSVASGPSCRLDVGTTDASNTSTGTTTGSSTSMSSTAHQFVALATHFTAPTNCYKAYPIVVGSDLNSSANIFWISYQVITPDAAGSITTYPNDPFSSFGIYYSMFGSGNQIVIANGDSLTVNWSWLI